MIGCKKPFNQPAKRAERVLAPADGEAEPGVTATLFAEPAKLARRVLAPGDGEAEPGETEPKTSQPAKWATDETCKIAQPGSIARFAGSSLGGGAVPRSRLRHRLGLPLWPPASQAGEWFLPTDQLVAAT